MHFWHVLSLPYIIIKFFTLLIFILLLFHFNLINSCIYYYMINLYLILNNKNKNKGV